MPYFITDRHPECANWSVVKEDGELVACHETKDEAIENMVAVSIAEGLDPAGEYEGQSFRSEARDLPDNYRPALADDVPEGRACGNCMFFNEDRVSEDGTKAWCERWDDFVDGGYYCNAWEAKEEDRQVNLVAPAYMRASARQGLKYYDEGLAGDGLVGRTVTEARQMARGDALTPDKWVRISAWIARHMVDLDAPDADPQADGYPSAGVVAHLLWGSGPSKRSAQRASDYADGVVGRLEEENSERTIAKGEVVKKLELRTNKTEFEVRDLEDGGMSFSGYASVFNSRSENLGGFTEFVAPGAFSRSLKSRNNMFLLYDHNPANVLASTRANTMRLTEDSHGLYVEADIAPTNLGKDMATLIRRGDLDSMSFGFSVIRDSWNDAGTERTLHAVRLAEVSVVASPAYTATAGTVAVRGLQKIANRAGVDSDQLADVLLKLEEGVDMSDDEVSLLSKVVDELKPEPEVVEEEVKSEPEQEVDYVALKKQKLKLLEMLSNG